MGNKVSLMFLLGILGLLFSTFSSSNGEWTQEREEILNENYLVHWSIDYENKLVRFNVTCRTLGWVGFGISTNGGMAGSDLVIGGVLSNWTAYFNDRHATGFTLPIIDESQDWELLGAAENMTHTSLQFQRLFDTCDPQDLAITNDTLNFIWSYGLTDEIGYHLENRGTVSVNILDMELPPVDLNKFSSFELLQNITMPSQETTYWCNILKSPEFNGKHHLVVFDSKLDTPEAKRHTHHYSVYKCVAPEGNSDDEYFGPFVGHPGEECYGEETVIPIRDCRQMLYVWAIGGRMFTLPDNVGYSVGETSAQEYYLLEVHYDNPVMVSDVQFATGAVIYYTDELRAQDAGVLYVGHDSSIAITMPPKSEEFLVVGHCQSECTAEMLPPDGVNAFAVFLHSHLSGRGHKLRLFREGEELPWPAVDANYNFDYQQTRLLKEPLKILPGDHLSAECSYSTDWRDDVTIGGLSSREEMCEHFVWYWPKSTLSFCLSSFPQEEMLKMFGIEEVTGPYYNPIVVAPEHLANLSYLQVMNDFVEWTPELRMRLQEAVIKSTHEGYCIPDRGQQLFFSTGYPQVNQDYQPPQTCPN